MRLFVLRRSTLRGTYTLLMVCKRPFKLRIGKLGLAQIKKGIYLYTGSALGAGAVSLDLRIARHRRRNKRVKWHVDYLTVRPEITIVSVVCIESKVRLECKINQRILSILNVEPILHRAGSSDCHCNAHLLFAGSLDSKTVLRDLKGVYATYGKPLML